MSLFAVLLFSMLTLDSKFVSEVLRARFPKVAERIDDCEAKLKAMGCKWATPLFGRFYNYCINGPRAQVLGVSTEPHVDGKNLALMLCGVFVWGEFHIGPLVIYCADTVR